MKTKTKTVRQSRPETLTLKLDPKRVPLLRACAAFDGQTPEEFAQDALRSAMGCVAEAIGHELRQES